MLRAAVDRPISQCTWAQFEVFGQCRRRYQQEFLALTPSEFQPVERFMDSVVREALNWFFIASRTGSVPTEAALAEQFDQRWSERLRPPVKIVRAGDRIEAYAHRGEMMLRRFHHEWTSSGGLRPEAVGRQFRLRLFSRFELTVDVDLVARDRDGGLHVVELVTGPRARGESDPDAPLRVKAWGLAVLLNWKADRVGLVRYLLSDGRRFKETLTRDEAVPLVSALAGRLEEMERCTQFPVRPSLRCAWCGYRSDCEESGFPSGFVPLSESEIGRCPKCASALGLRHGRLGVFVTCARYPDCRYSKDL